MRQHTEGMVGSIKCILLEIYFSSQQWKNFENPLRIDKVIAMSSMYYIFGTQCTVGKICQLNCNQRKITCVLSDFCKANLFGSQSMNQNKFL